MSVLNQIKGWLEKDKSVKRVAKDLQLTSELILLVRMMFADGELKPEELQNFKRICNIAFDIPEDEVSNVIRYLQDFGYETTTHDAAQMFKELDDERKKSLLLHLLSIAKSDNELHSNEVQMLQKTAAILGIGSEDLEKYRASD